jgi:integrase/acylphosphatase
MLISNFYHIITMPLVKDYELFLTEQTHIAPQTMRNVRGMLSRFPAPSELDAKWFRKRLKEVAPTTARNELKLAKQVFRWLGLSTEDLKRVKIPKGEGVTVDDLYTREELTAIFGACHDTRDKAIIEVLFESACRASELLSMTFETVNFNDDGTAAIVVHGKTGTRQALIFQSVPALKLWMNVHPTGKGRVWLTLRQPYEPLTYSGLFQLVRKKVRAAGLKRPKRKLVHMFRHSRITELVKLNVRGQTLAKLVGWTKDSNMESIYVHLSTADVEIEVKAKVFGLEPDEAIYEPLLKSTACPRCNTRNEQSARVCIGCNLPLSNEAIVKALEQQKVAGDLEGRVANLEDLIRQVALGKVPANERLIIEVYEEPSKKEQERVQRELEEQIEAEESKKKEVK